MSDEVESGPAPRRNTLLGILRTSVSEMSPRERWGWAVILLGLGVILAGVLHLTAATVGGPIHEFKDRRTYTEVKSAAHRAFPASFALGLAGLAVAWLGARLRASGRRSDGAS